MFHLTYYKTVVDEEETNPYTNDRIVFENPAELAKSGVQVDNFGKKFANYTKLDATGMPKLNEKITEGDVYVGKCLVQTEMVEDAEDDSIFKARKNTEIYKDMSIVADKIMSGIVDKVYTFEKPDGTKTTKIRFRKTRTPVLGDKLGSRMAQKGVVGMIMNHEDMPYTKDGIVPDLIINPHAIPTRMTIAHLIDCILSKLGCVEGRFYDGTPFCDQDIEAAYERLQDNGFQKHGDEVMYNGITGEQIPTDIFIGPTFYTRMKHMVEDKDNARGGGPDANYIGLTRQPAKSRSKGGAGRVGEMEMASIVSHGISSFLKECVMEKSDKYEYYIDDESGDIAVSNDKRGFARSLTNEDATEFSRVQTPFATKLLLQEMEAMSIMPRVICGEGYSNRDGDDETDDYYLADIQEEDDEYDEGPDAIADLDV